MNRCVKCLVIFLMLSALFGCKKSIEPKAQYHSDNIEINKFDECSNDDTANTNLDFKSAVMQGCKID